MHMNTEKLMLMEDIFAIVVKNAFYTRFMEILVKNYNTAFWPHHITLSPLQTPSIWYDTTTDLIFSMCAVERENLAAFTF